MEFIRYKSLKRLGTTEVEDITIGEIYVFPKIDGTNSSIYLGEDGEVKAGSRNRELSLDKDNANFYSWVKDQKNIRDYLIKYPNHILYGEWLVPHSLKTYRDNAWNNFYIFDVLEISTYGKYLHYEEYKSLLEEFNLEYIPPICVIDNPSEEQLYYQLENNNYLVKDGQGNGEGIVIKNYNYLNRYGRIEFAKIVTSEFKAKHTRTMGPPNKSGKNLVEKLIAEEFVTSALVLKTYSKIENKNSGFKPEYTKELLNTVYYDVVNEESWNYVKKYKNPVIDFKKLMSYVYMECKIKCPQFF